MKLRELHADWFILGLNLEVPFDRLERIKTRVFPTLRQCFEGVLAEWMKLDPSKRTWEVLFEAVSRCGNRALAEGLKEHPNYSKESPGMLAC